MNYFLHISEIIDSDDWGANLQSNDTASKQGKKQNKTEKTQTTPPQTN